METLLETNLGYVTCDICGEGYNGVGVWFDPNAADADRPFRVIRRSKCYGQIDKSNLSKEGVLQFLQENNFLVATRYARKQYNKFIRDLKNDRVPIVETAATEASAQEDLWAPAPVPSLADLVTVDVAAEDPSWYDEPYDVEPESDRCSRESGCSVCWPELTDDVTANGVRQEPEPAEFTVTSAPVGTVAPGSGVLPDWLRTVRWSFLNGNGEVI